jgi:hypothetical protein
MKTALIIALLLVVVIILIGLIIELINAPEIEDPDMEM